MGRNFDGNNDSAVFGSDASIDNFTTLSMSMWVKMNSLALATQELLGKQNTAASWALRVRDTGKLTFDFDWTTDGKWDNTNTALDTSGFFHIGATYDKSSVSNDPVFFINAVDDGTTEVQAPSGITAGNDASNNLRAGLNSGNGEDLSGILQNLCYANAIWDAAQFNRARWWGDPGGAFAVKHPFFTTKVANEGSATADASLGGTSMASLPRVERRWGAMMGCGR